MEEEVLQHHISQQFNTELAEIRTQVLNMGGLVEEQLKNAIIALTDADEKLARKVYTNDFKINALEVRIDEECTRILARRQPAASDLRLVMAVVKMITDLERIGDQAERIARMSIQINNSVQNKSHTINIAHLGERVQKMLHDALDAFVRMDVELALKVLHEDRSVDAEYEGISRQLMTYMMEDARTIPTVLNLLWSARALERIGDHANNMCEHLIYFVKGKDIRHISLEQVEQEARES